MILAEPNLYNSVRVSSLQCKLLWLYETDPEKIRYTHHVPLQHNNEATSEQNPAT